MAAKNVIQFTFENGSSKKVYKAATRVDFQYLTTCFRYDIECWLEANYKNIARAIDSGFRLVEFHLI